MMTPLDHAHTAMEAAPDDDKARMRFYERLMDGKLCILLSEEASGDHVTPDIFVVDNERFALVFDTDERMSEFTQTVSPHLTASGRQIITLVAGQGVGLGVNLGVAPSSILLPANAIDWMAARQGAAVSNAQELPVAVSLPSEIPQSLLQALDVKLASMSGLANCAYLAECEYASGSKILVLAFIDSNPQAHSAMAQAISEMLAFSGLEAAAIDVTFLPSTHPAIPALAENGLRFDVPTPDVRQAIIPGGDPDKPPKLR